MKLTIEMLIKYNEARTEMDSRFKGLLHAHTTLIKSLITLANPLTGIVTNITYSNIAELLTVNKAPGRTESGAPKKETIRSYLRSIEKQCPEDFKVISEGQKLQFNFPNLPEIYARFLGKNEVYTGNHIEQNSAKLIENAEKSNEIDTQEYTELYTDQYTPTPHVKKLCININNKTNNNNLGEAVESKSLKQPISPNFYPNEKTIARANASGYSFATDAHVIQEFIDKNIAWGSEFADFNPVYLSFLAKHEHFQQQRPALQNIQGQSRRTTDERTFIKRNSYDAALEQALRDNADAISPSDQHLLSSQQAIPFEFKPTEHFLALGRIDQDVRSIVC